MKDHSERPLTAGELIERQKNDPEWIEAKRKRDEDRERREREIAQIEAPLDTELKAAGVAIRGFRDLHKKPKNFKIAIPIVVRHLAYDNYPEPTKNSMAQSIAFKETNPYWRDLLKLFVDNSTKDGIFRQGLAVALASSYSQKELQTLIDLCNSREYGTTRVLLADGLRRSKSEAALTALLRLANDDQIGEQITKWLRKSSSRSLTKQ